MGTEFALRIEHSQRTMFAARRMLTKVVQEGSRLSAYRVKEITRNFRVSCADAAKFSRYPVPEFSTIPDDLQNRLTEYALESGDMLNVFSALSYRPDELRAFLNYFEIVMANRGSLTTTDKEMIILATSAANKCLCCIVIHGAFHRICSKNPRLADQLTANWRTADLDERQQAILDFAMDICHSKPVTDEKITSLEKHGLSKDDIWDIGSVVSFISLANRMVTMLNVKPNNEFYSMGRISEDSK